MQSTPAQGGKPSARERFSAMLAEWGMLLLVVHYVIFGLVLVGCAMAIKLGFGFEEKAGALGTWGAAYFATQLVKPLRFAATAVITPALGTLIRRIRRRRQSSAQGSTPQPGPAQSSPAQGSAAEAPERGPVASLDERPSGRS